LHKSPIRVLVVDDHEPWRRYYSTTLGKEQGLEIIGAASNGLEAVQQAQELQPDLILLDIGLPILNGIEAARRIREVSPMSKILFVSENRSADVTEAALSTGAGGYVVKSDAGRELLPGVEAVLNGRLFISIGVAAHHFSAPVHDRAGAITYSHEVAFYADDSSVVDGQARFIESSLQCGKAVIVVVTESHRASLLLKLEADGVDVSAATERGRFFQFDVAETLSRVTVNDVPDPLRFKNVVSDLIMVSAKRVMGEHARVAACGEMAPTLLSKGNAEGAIKLEHLWSEVTRDYGVHTLCSYLSGAFPQHGADPVFRRICAEHTAVHGRELSVPG
jgi:CheY-like chemotaxis protein